MDKLADAEADYIAARRNVERLRSQLGQKSLDTEDRERVLENLAEDLALRFDDRGDQSGQGQGQSDGGADTSFHETSP